MKRFKKHIRRPTGNLIVNPDKSFVYNGRRYYPREFWERNPRMRIG